MLQWNQLDLHVGPLTGLDTQICSTSPPSRWDTSHSSCQLPQKKWTTCLRWEISLLLFLFPPHHLHRDRSHWGKWLSSHCYLFESFLMKMSDNLVTESSKPWIKEVLEDTEESLCSCFLLMSLKCSRAALLTVVLLDARQLQHPHLGVCIGLHHSCFWRIDRAALFQNDGNL